MEDRGLTLKGEITMMKAMKNFMDKPITYGGLCEDVYRRIRHQRGVCGIHLSQAWLV